MGGAIGGGTGSPTRRLKSVLKNWGHGYSLGVRQGKELGQSGGENREGGGIGAGI